MKTKNIDLDAPAEVLHLAMASHFNIPIGVSVYENTIKKYPEYFPKEYNRMMAWESIPQETHDEYWAEHKELDAELKKDEPKKDGGIFEAMNNTPEFQVWKKWFDNDYYPKFEVMQNKLHKKYYSKYGI